MEAAEKYLSEKDRAFLFSFVSFLFFFKWGKGERCKADRLLIKKGELLNLFSFLLLLLCLPPPCFRLVKKKRGGKGRS